MNKNKTLKFIFFFLVSFPKTLWFNLRSLPFKQAIKIPILIGYNIKIKAVHKKVICFESTVIKPLSFRIGWGGSSIVPVTQHGAIALNKNAKMIVKGRVCFAAGSILDVSGNLSFGKNFSSNKNAFVSCSKKIVFGDDVMLGWNVSLFDANGHTVYFNGEAKESQKEILIGNHVWLASNSQILKGAVISQGSIVAWGSVVSKTFFENNILIAGNPGIKKADNIEWGKDIG